MIISQRNALHRETEFLGSKHVWAQRSVHFLLSPPCVFAIHLHLMFCITGDVLEIVQYTVTVYASFCSSQFVYLCLSAHLPLHTQALLWWAWPSLLWL